MLVDRRAQRHVAEHVLEPLWRHYIAIHIIVFFLGLFALICIPWHKPSSRHRMQQSQEADHCSFTMGHYVEPGQWILCMETLHRLVKSTYDISPKVREFCDDLYVADILLQYSP